MVIPEGWETLPEKNAREGKNTSWVQEVVTWGQVIQCPCQALTGSVAYVGQGQSLTLRLYSDIQHPAREDLWPAGARVGAPHSILAFWSGLSHSNSGLSSHTTVPAQPLSWNRSRLISNHFSSDKGTFSGKTELAFISPKDVSFGGSTLLLAAHCKETMRIAICVFVLPPLHC